MDSDHYITLAVVVLYFTLVILIGYHFYRKSKGMSDYILGGRSLNPYVTALSAQASDMSGWLLMGLPGSIYLAGIGQVWIGIGLCIGSYISWLIIAKRLRVYSEKAGNSLTLSEYFANRFRDSGNVLRNVSAVIILVFFTIYVASGFVGAGNVFRMIIPDLDYVPAMIIGAVVVVAYTALGGFKAVSWTDLIQAMLMIFAIVFVALFALGDMGGWNNVSDILDGMVGTEDHFGDKLPDHFLDIMFSNGSPIDTIVLVSCLVWGLGYLGMPHVIIRYTAIRNPDEIKVARRVGVTWTAICLAFSCFVAILGRAYFSDGLANPENVFIQLTDSMLPAIVAALIYSALLAAIMSTADSQLLVASSAICNDLYKSFTKNNPSDRSLMNMSRAVVVGIAVIGALLALDRNGAIMDLVSYAWAGFGAAFGPVVLLSLLWKRANKEGALAGMIVGFITIIVWNTCFVAGGIIGNGSYLIYDTGLYELAPGFLLAFVAIILVSLMTEPPGEEIEKEFEEVDRRCRTCEKDSSVE